VEAEIKDIIHEDASLCGQEAVLAFLDGLPGPEAMLAFESHLEVCSGCRESVNREKLFSGLLDTSLVSEPEVPLPKDFAKRVAVTAESSVVGTADRSNTLRAAVIVAVLLFLAAIAAGEKGISVASLAVEQLGVIALAVMHLVYSIGVSVAVLMRAATAPVVDGPLTLPVLALFVAVAMFIFFRSRQPGNTAN